MSVRLRRGLSPVVLWAGFEHQSATCYRFVNVRELRQPRR
jgi:hypothetical protein